MKEKKEEVIKKPDPKILGSGYAYQAGEAIESYNKRMEQMIKEIEEKPKKKDK